MVTERVLTYGLPESFSALHNVRSEQDISKPRSDGGCSP